MKEKRILAMFIASAVTLVASLSITFGVLQTLADPVVATGIVKYAYNFGGEVNALVTEEGRSIKIKEDIIFQPSSSLDWKEASSDPNAVDADKQTVWFDGLNYESDIWYDDESIPSKLKVIPVRITNSFDRDIEFKLEVNFDKTSPLGKYTYVKLYDYTNEEQSFETIIKDKRFSLKPGQSVDYAIIVYSNDADNLGVAQIDWGNDWLKLNVQVTNLTVFEQ